MPELGYQQYCALARTLDVVGDRWTLLIVRELVPGPRRFTDLLGGLPGVSRNLLTERLRVLERERVIVRTQLPAPAARQVYELTDDGRDLALAMVRLAAWGARRLGERQPSDTFQTRWSAVGMASLADREAAKGIRETYQYRVGDAAFHFTVDDGSIEVRDGLVQGSAVTLTTDDETWANIVSGKVSTSSARATGALTVVGEPQAVKRMGRIFSRTHMLARGTPAVADGSHPVGIDGPSAYGGP